MSQKKVVIKALFGPPLAGKGYIAKKAEEHGIAVLSMSSILSRHGEFSEQIRKGELVPCCYVINLLKTELETFIYTKKAKKILLDGFPRTLEQVDFFCGLPYENIGLVHLNVSEDVLMSRLKKRMSEQSRQDDNVEIFERRISEFKNIKDSVLSLANRHEKCYVMCAKTDTEEDSEKTLMRIIQFMDKNQN